MINVAVGSKNPVKCNAAEQGLKLALKTEEINVEGFDAPSGVRDQPIGDLEIKSGAMNRARQAFIMFKERNGIAPAYSVGIEGGILINNEGADDEEIDCMAWIVTYDGIHYGKARTSSFNLPKVICDLLKEGVELGTADDMVFSRMNSKQGEGTVGHLTRGVMDRTAYYVPAVVLAMIPLQWPSLWPH
jgi:inosine/xanthosine triphosphatase